VSSHLQHRLHTILTTAVDMLGLPLDSQHVERLALELTPAVKAILAEQANQLEETVPVTYAVADPAASADVDVSEYAGCTSRIRMDVDLDSPAALMAQQLRSTQPDVTATEVPDATTLGITVNPQSIDAWRWWLHYFGIDPATVETEGGSATATGHRRGVTVHLRGDSVPELLTDRAAARLMGVIAEPARS